LSLSTPAVSERPVSLLRYFDVVLVLVAAPIMLLIGVPAVGYLVGAGAWILLRGVGVAADRVAEASRDASKQIAVRMSFMLGRLFLLAMAVIAARQASRNDGLTALIVIAFAFTMWLGLLAVNRPRSR
jgi:hypothetical protein